MRNGLYSQKRHTFKNGNLFNNSFFAVFCHKFKMGIKTELSLLNTALKREGKKKCEWENEVYLYIYVCYICICKPLPPPPYTCDGVLIQNEKKRGSN